MIQSATSAPEGRSFDTIIVGGGVIGLALAYELSARGERVCILDRHEPGRQASWAAAGILPPADRQQAYDALEQLRGWSHQLFPEWARQLEEKSGIDPGYRQCGGLHVARGAAEAAALGAAARQWRADGIEVRQLELEDLPSLEPALRASVAAGKLRAVFHVPSEAQIRSPFFLKALLRACQQNRVEILPHRPVDRWERHEREIRAVWSRGDRLCADKFCVAAGPWSAELLEPFGLRIDLRPWRGQIVLFRAPGASPRHVINEGLNYLVPRDDGRVLAGSTMEDVGFDCQTTQKAIEDLVAFAEDLVPALSAPHVERTWAGLRPGSGDGFPFLGHVTGFSNFYLASGHFRSGIHLAPATAVVMSQLMRGESPAVSLRAFRIDRG